jgi:DHA2 family multidrug resistance protein
VESFPKKKHGMAIAVHGMGVVLAPIIGPTRGGWITYSYSWRWTFFINIPVGVLSLTLTTLLIFDPPYLERRTFGKFRLDYIGLGLIATGRVFSRFFWTKAGFLEVFQANARLVLVAADCGLGRSRRSLSNSSGSVGDLAPSSHRRIAPAP